MALIKCERCGGLVSDQAITCPHCGNLVKSPPAKKRKTARSSARHTVRTIIFVSLAVIFCLAAVFIFSIRKYNANHEIGFSFTKEQTSSATDSSTASDAENPVKEKDPTADNDIWYSVAMGMMEEKDYATASTIFESLGDYEDSKEKVHEAYSLWGKMLEDEKKYYQACIVYNYTDQFADEIRAIKKDAISDLCSKYISDGMIVGNSRKIGVFDAYRFDENNNTLFLELSINDIAVTHAIEVSFWRSVWLDGGDAGNYDDAMSVIDTVLSDCKKAGINNISVVYSFFAEGNPNPVSYHSDGSVDLPY